jgi:type I restriction enzyme R subunit
MAQPFPLYYDAGGERPGLATTERNEKIAAAIECAEINAIDVVQRMNAELKRNHYIITSKKRLEQVARGFVGYYSERCESDNAMLVCIDKLTCARMHNLIPPLQEKRIHELDAALKEMDDYQNVQQLHTRQIARMRETLMAAVVSEEWREVERFKKWRLNIKPHRKVTK